MKDYELLEKQAAMMRMAEKYGVDDWRKLVKVQGRLSGTWFSFADDGVLLRLDQFLSHKFALGVVEGRPVFEGDTLYMPNGDAVTVGTYPTSLIIANGSWNQPKPKTVMVELLVEDAEWLANVLDGEGSWNTLQKACRKALEVGK